MYVTLGTATGPNLSLKRKAFEENKKHPSRTSMFLLRFILMFYSSDQYAKFLEWPLSCHKNRFFYKLLRLICPPPLVEV